MTQTVDQIRTQGMFRLFGLAPNTKEWALANFELGKQIKDAGGHHEAVEYLMYHALFTKSIADLELIVLLLNDDKKRAEILKQGIDWEFSTTNDWTKWRYYDDLSVVGYYNGALKEEQKDTQNKTHKQNNV